MNLGLLTGAPGTAMLAPPLLLSGSSPPPPPSPDAQLHALRRTISTLIERYASLARTQLRGGLDVRLPEGDAVLDALALQGAREADGLRAQLAELRETNRQGARRVEQERQRCAAAVQGAARLRHLRRLQRRGLPLLVRARGKHGTS